ncbi:MAG: tripartite tricarboxylate transporter TctB family protein [Pseudorhodoplanes sp.]
MIAAVAFSAAAITMPMGTITAPGPGLVPLLLSVATAIAAGSALWTSFRGRSEESTTEDSPRPFKAMIICAILAGAIFAFERIGFLATSFLCVFILLKFVERKSWAVSIIVPAILSGGSYLALTHLLRMNLP